MNSWESLISHWDARLQKAFLESIYALRNQAQIDAITRMLAKGDVDGALRAVGINPASFRPLDKAIAQAFEAGAVVTAQQIPPTVVDGLRVVFQFNVRNLAAERWLRDYSGNLITEIVADQKTAIRSFLTAGMEKGLNPKTVALDLVGRIGASGSREGGIVGLTSSQEGWVRTFEDDLTNSPASALEKSLRDRRFDPAIRRAIASGKPIPDFLKAKMVAAYKNRALRYRAEAIGRTEAMSSLHAAQEQAIDQAIQSGAVQAANVAYVWKTARDKRVRDTHRSMDGQRRKQGEDFITGSGAHLRYPGDPSGPAEEVIQCRCFREVAVDFLAGIK